MKSIKLKHGKILTEHVLEPHIKTPTQVKVKISYCSICGYERDVYNGKFSGFQDLILGHEASGIVTEVGEKVENIYPGDAVTLSPYSYCGYCENCKKGLQQFCSHQYQQHSPFMAEYVVVDQKNVFVLPSKEYLREGCLIEPLSVSLCAVEKARLDYRRKLLIIGCGAMGMLALQVARLNPAAGIVIMDPNENKRKLALQLGATMAISPDLEDLYYHLMDYTNGNGFDAIIEASGNSSSAQTAFHLLARGGNLVFLSIYESDFELRLSPLSLYYKDATIQAVFPSAEAFGKAANVLQRMNLKPLITAIYPYQEAAKAFYVKSTQHEHIKVILDFSN